MRIKIQLSHSALMFIEWIKNKYLMDNGEILTNGQATALAFNSVGSVLEQLDYMKLAEAENDLLKEFIDIDKKFIESEYITTLNLPPEAVVQLNRAQLIFKQQLSANRIKKSAVIKKILIAYLLKEKGELENYLI